MSAKEAGALSEVLIATTQLIFCTHDGARSKSNVYLYWKDLDRAKAFREVVRVKASLSISLLRRVSFAYIIFQVNRIEVRVPGWAQIAQYLQSAFLIAIKGDSGIYSHLCYQVWWGA